MEALASEFALTTEITDEKRQALFASFDLNGNSSLELDEFCKTIVVATTW